MTIKVVLDRKTFKVIGVETIDEEGVSTKQIAEIIAPEIEQIIRESKSGVKTVEVDMEDTSTDNKNPMLNLKLSDMPEVLTAKYIASYLHVSVRRAYELMQWDVSIGGIPSFEIGKSKRAFKVDFEAWLKGANSLIKRSNQRED